MNEKRQRHAPPASAEAGFSLAEMLVALTVTALISGSIFTMMTVAQRTAKREPALADRQQNIRAALMLIERDVMNAGQDVPASVQTFKEGLNAVGPMGPYAQNSDFLQIVGNDGRCPTLDVCSPGQSGGTGVSISTKQPFPACMSLPGLIMLSSSTDSGIFWACPPGNGANASCGGHAAGGGADNGHAVVPPRVPEFNPPGGPDFTPQFMSTIQVVRYEIRIDTDGTPNLWRSPVGGVDMSGISCGGGAGGGSAGWQLVARGIEDLQVQYLNGNGAWLDDPGLVSADYATLVRQVRITLSGRTVNESNLQGQSRPTNTAVTAVRGQLTTIITPRAVLTALAQADPEPLWR